MSSPILRRALPLRPETILFVGAGATSQLNMPTTDEQAKILWRFCDSTLTGNAVEEIAKCFKDDGQKIVNLLKVVDPGESGTAGFKLEDDVRAAAFPDLNDKQVHTVVSDLRRHYDWSALKLVAKAKKGNASDDNPRENYLQEVFTLIDACLRESRGFNVYLQKDGDLIYLSVERLQAARELLVLLINTMFACAWKKLVTEDEGLNKLKPYRAFFDSLARMQQDEGVRFANEGLQLNRAEFYKFSYALVTTNFEPLFLWLAWQGHLKANHGKDIRVGNPGRRLKLLMNFPTTVGMRAPADEEVGESPDSHIWLPCTEAVAQNVNKEKYVDERAYRLGVYAPVHGMSTFRHCPVCGRLNLYLGDSWDANSETLFPNGITAELRTGQKARTVREDEARKRGEFDALECHFCGAMTHAYDNFMFMQTQLKCPAPSFIKEMTDDALSLIAGAKHIVLLGYSLPLDDAIWGSLLTTMSRRSSDEKLYCSVVLYAKDGEDRWIEGEDIDSFIEKHDVYVRDKEDVRGLKNAVAVFGKKNVRAYMAGVPSVFGLGSKMDVRKLLYPTKEETGWDISSFKDVGVIRVKEDFL